MNSKRNILKTITGLSVSAALIPNSWVKPVISTVILPAHAQTSVASDTVATPVSGVVTFTIDSGVFSFFEVGAGQTQFDASEFSGSVSASDGNIPAGAEVRLNATLNPGGQTFTSTAIVQSDGSFSSSFGDTQFIATGNISATGVFAFSDTITFGNSTFTFTDLDLIN